MYSEIQQNLRRTDSSLPFKETGDLEARKIKKLKSFSDEELEQSLKALVKKENELLCDIILHIKEVEVRKLYLKKACESLFVYLTKYMGYGNGSAQRRIDAARLSIDVPELIENIKAGELNLAQVSLVQHSIRQKQAELTKLNMKLGEKANIKIEAKTKIQVIESIKGKSVTETELIVSKALEIEIKSKPKVIRQVDKSVRLEVTFTKEQWAKLERMRSLISHSVPDGSWDQVFEHVADKVIASKTKTRCGGKVRVRVDDGIDKIKSQNESAGAVQSEPESNVMHLESGSKTVGEAKPKPKPNTESYYQLRKQLLSKHAACQHVDKTSNRKCTSTWKLQADHITPKWAGGKDTPENLQVLCAQHNRWRYQQQAGIQKL